RPWPCCLCSCRHGAAPALHSFPTRRSSDLGEAGGQARHLLFHFDPAQATVAVEIGGVEALVEAALALGLALRALGLLPGAQLGADRKSTRLNSSHVKISYAVFCLKKKKSKT